MNNTLFSSTFRFLDIHRDTYHYSDNRSGSHEHYLAHLLCGRCRIVSDSGSIEIEKGDVFYIPKGLPYRSYLYGESEIRFLSCGFQFFPDADDGGYALQVIPCDDSHKALIDAVPVGHRPQSAALGAFYTALASVLPLMQRTSCGSRELTAYTARQYLYAHPESSVGAVARYCGVSESTLYTLFRQVFGKTPNAVRLETLCEQAVLLLSTTDRSVQEISDTLGFSSTSYFRKTLRQQLGKTPREIRRDAASV